MFRRKNIALVTLLANVLLLGACAAAEEETPSEVSADTSSQEVSSETIDSSASEEEETTGLITEEALLEPSNLYTLVNKQYSLEEDYAPEDLVTVEVPTVLEDPEIKQLRKPAADALKDMFDGASEDDITLYARSGYRSYQTQVHLFNNYVSNHGEEAANKYSARPGESEHQTGLAMDVTSESVNYQLTEDFGETPEGTWVKNHAYEYGFIIRYPEGKSDITGYIFEPWHLRYLGEELAQEVYESGLTYEEYILQEGIDIETND